MRIQLALGMLAILVIAQQASAQLSNGSTTSRTSTSNNNSNNNSLFGATSFPTLGFGTIGQTFGATNSAGGGAGSGNMLRAALGQGNTGFGGNGMNSMFGMGGLGMGGLGGMNRFGMGGMGGMGGNLQNQNMMNRNTPGANLRIPMRVNFTLPKSTPTMATRATTFETRLTKLPGLTSAKNVVVTLDGGTVVLSGSVSSSDEKALVEQLARFEPGVSQVRNELQVSSTSEPPAVEALPTPAKANP